MALETLVRGAPGCGDGVLAGGGDARRIRRGRRVLSHRACETCVPPPFRRAELASMTTRAPGRGTQRQQLLRFGHELRLGSGQHRRPHRYPQLVEWFRGPNSARYLAAVYAQSGQNSPYTEHCPIRGPNQIVMFKSCFPNSSLAGGPNDNAAVGNQLTVANAKYVYNELLRYFATRPDKLFVVVTAPRIRKRSTPPMPGHSTTGWSTAGAVRTTTPSQCRGL